MGRLISHFLAPCSLVVGLVLAGPAAAVTGWDGTVISGVAYSGTGSVTATYSGAATSGSGKNVKANTAITGKKYWALKWTFGQGSGVDDTQSTGVSTTAFSTSGVLGSTSASNRINPNGIDSFNGSANFDFTLNRYDQTPLVACWILVAEDQPNNKFWVYTGACGAGGETGWLGSPSSSGVASNPLTGTGGIAVPSSTHFPAVALAQTGDSVTIDGTGVGDGSFSTLICSLVGAGFSSIDASSPGCGSPSGSGATKLLMGVGR